MKFRRILSLLAMVVVGTSITLLVAQTAKPSRQPFEDIDASWRDNADPDFVPRRLMQPLKPITEFKTRSVASALTEMEPNELVLSVSIEGQHRAYPINMLTGPRREIINDNLGGKSIAATW